MASTVLPNGIIIPEKYSRDWYNDLYHNWQELDNLLGGGTPKDGTLTIQKNGATVGTFSANQATDETINITVPDVNDATLTIQKNGTTVDTFTANSSTDKTVNITVPTKTSDLTNDSDFVQSSDLATVATSGDYDDLSNKPTIPTVNNATLTIQKNGTNVQTFTANQSTNATANITVPTKTSDLTNDSGFITSDNTKIPLAGSNQISGSLIPSTDGTVNLGSSSYQWNNAYIKSLTIGGVVMTGSELSRVDNTSVLAIRGGSGYDQGAQLTLYGKDVSGYEGYAYLRAADGANASEFALRPNSHATISCTSFRPLYGNPTLGDASSKWGQIYSTNSTISTSDERQKANIKQIDDKLLNAWENVNIVQFNFKDALEKKGDNARLHTGYIAQNIQQACEENGVNPNDYGLFCFDSWEEQEEKKDENGQVIEPYRAKGDLYSLRYEEALVVECAYLRRCVARLTARIEELEKGNNTK